MVIDLQTFRLAPGIDEAAFLVADRVVQNEFVPNLPGFARRTTGRGTHGDWLVVTLWSGSEHAEAADRLAETHDATRAFAALIDDETRERFTTLD